MWLTIANFILRKRLFILISLAIITLFMGHNATKVKLSYGLPEMLPAYDSTILKYQEFRNRFGEESFVLIVGVKKDIFENVELFNDWYLLNQNLKAIDGVDTIISASSVYNLVKITDEKRFSLEPIVTGPLSTQKELDSLKNIIQSLPFYEGVLFNTKTNVSLIAISLNKDVFYSEDRMRLIDELFVQTDGFGEGKNIQMHYSGLPHIRTVMTQLVKSELMMFVVFAALVTILILFFFFRSIKPVWISMLVVILGVIWSLGTMVLLGYEINILSSIIPPLIIVIGIPNCIFLINKYHSEFKLHGNKIKALTRVITKIGRATMMTNATTAIGFLTFGFTASKILVEFGILATFSIVFIFTFSILLIPIIYSYQADPKERHINHLNYSWMENFVNKLVIIVSSHHTKVYWIVSILLVLSFIGISKIQVTGNLVDDLPKNHQVRKDLKFFEDNFAGVMPFLISIDGKQPREILNFSTLKRMEKLQDKLVSYPEFSKPLSIVDGIKFTKQAFYGGNPKKYELINTRERAFFKPYIDNATGNTNFLKTFMDTSYQYARINVQVADLGTHEMEALVEDLRPRIDSIFPPEKFNVVITGQSIVYLKGTTYLVENLFMSLAIAIVLVGFIMALLFSSLRMILISIATNLIPLIITAGLMGYFNINLKPSTILVFSIAFGISVDDTIHFLAKFRQEYRAKAMNIREAVLISLKDTGTSMIYTSIILFFGFSVFDSSEFGGTQALGVLVSCTLFVAMLANLIFLPSMLLTLEKRILTKAFNEPMMDIYDEEEDIDLNILEIDKGNYNIQNKDE